MIHKPVSVTCVSETTTGLELLHDYRFQARYVPGRHLEHGLIGDLKLRAAPGTFFVGTRYELDVEITGASLPKR